MGSLTLTRYLIPAAPGRLAYAIDADPGSRVAQRLAMGLPYEHKLLSYIAQRLPPYRGVAVDVGAHIGNHALYLAALGLRVVAFEPIHVAALRANLRLNLDLNVTMHSVALGDREGWVCAVGFDHQVAPESWGDVEMDTCDARTPGAVPMRTLDSFKLSGVSLIKADVEGMEMRVLLGARDTLKRCRPDVYVEARDREAHDAITAVMEPLGYAHALTAHTSTPVELWSPTS